MILRLVLLVNVAFTRGSLLDPPKLPPIRELEKWWGSKELEGTQDTSIRPFKIIFSNEMISDLRYRLLYTKRPPPPLEGVAFEYGFNTDQLGAWLSYWGNEYQFKEREKFLNQYPQFKTNIQGLDIHYIRVKQSNIPSNIEVVPILLLHGWPGCFREFYETIPIIASVDNRRDYALEVIVPSLPGYGYSDAPLRPGMGTEEIAVVMKNLMNRLGYKRFYIQGGDLGALVCRSMATLFPNEILGYHSNLGLVLTPQALAALFVGALNPPFFVGANVADRVYPLSKYLTFLIEESGYLHIQATKPDTVGVGLSDSPAGLLAYLLEKFSTGTNPNYKRLKDGGLTIKYNPQKLLDIVTTYWNSNSIITALRLYAEILNRRTLSRRIDQIPTPVPYWALQSKYELTYQPQYVLKSKYVNLVNTTVIDFGGHFIALEEPKIFGEDVIKAVGEFRMFHKRKDSS